MISVFLSVHSLRFLGGNERCTRWSEPVCGTAWQAMSSNPSWWAHWGRAHSALPPSSAALCPDPLHLYSQRALQLRDLSLPAPAGLSLLNPQQNTPPAPKKIVIVNPPLAELHFLFSETVTLLPARITMWSFHFLFAQSWFFTGFEHMI